MRNEVKEYFWQMQGLTSFCKAKGDWLPYERIHLSFVKHEGKDKGCKQVLAIEGALKVHGADGALYLSELILSGGVKKLAERSRANPNENGYLTPIFQSMGGTVTSRAQDGKCIFRQFSLAPGKKSDYVFSMMMCDGEETKTGGIQPIKNAKRETIYVSLNTADLVDFAASFKAEYAAYRMNMMMQSQEAQPAAGDKNPNAAGGNHNTPATTKSQNLAIMYEQSGMINNGLPFVTELSGATALMEKVVRAIAKAPQGYSPDNPQFVAKAKQLIAKGAKGNTVIPFTGTDGEKTALVLVVDNAK